LLKFSYDSKRPFRQKNKKNRINSIKLKYALSGLYAVRIGILKNVEMKLIAELMRNSRRSDRELAHAIGVSQPTVSRMIRGLKKQGIIKEYTIIPDFKKLGYTLASFTFVRLNSKLTREEIQKAREITTHDMCKECPSEVVLFERGIGMGMGFTAVIIAFHRDYASYTRLRDKIKIYNFIDQLKTDSFMIDLKDEVHYRYLTFSTLAQNLLESQ
jgi:DNA-binding Lrp family transcriptional regulator